MQISNVIELSSFKAKKTLQKIDRKMKENQKINAQNRKSEISKTGILRRIILKS